MQACVTNKWFQGIGEEKVSKFKTLEIGLNGNRSHSLVNDFETPDEKKMVTWKLPLSIKQEEVTVDQLPDFTEEFTQSSGSKTTKKKYCHKEVIVTED